MEFVSRKPFLQTVFVLLVIFASYLITITAAAVAPSFSGAMAECYQVYDGKKKSENYWKRTVEFDQSHQSHSNYGGLEFASLMENKMVKPSHIGVNLSLTCPARKNPSFIQAKVAHVLDKVLLSSPLSAQLNHISFVGVNCLFFSYQMQQGYNGGGNSQVVGKPRMINEPTIFKCPTMMREEANRSKRYGCSISGLQWDDKLGLLYLRRTTVVEDVNVAISLGFSVYHSSGDDGGNDFMEIPRKRSVYGPTLSYNFNLVSSIHQHSDVTLTLLLAFTSAISLIFTIISRRKVMELNKQLLNQKKAYELMINRKNMSIAQASHDIRASLAAISSLAQLNSYEVTPGSYLQSNLSLMDSCTRDLLDLLNSVLDQTKVEAGKMGLQLSEFNLLTLLEDTVDLFHPVGMKTGVDLILDPCDTSLTQFSTVIGDRGKLKRVISNLLSKAVKFTSQGYICLRAWARKAHDHKSGIDDHIIHSFKKGCRDLSFPWWKKKDYGQTDEDQDWVEFVFEVEDTGKGLPKDKRKAVFEDYVQVKGTDQAGGTGLGLGIVRSLVRLMGGDIDIVDKKSSKASTGTCFRFNIFLKTKKEGLSSSIHVPAGFLRANKTKLARPSLVILFISNEGRREIIGRYIESLDINLIMVDEPKHLPRATRELSHQVTIDLPDHSLSRSASSPAWGNDGGESGVMLKVDDETYKTEVKVKGSSGLIPIGFLLLIIDEAVEEISSLVQSVSEFKKQLSDIDSGFKVIWLKDEQKKLRFQGSGEEYYKDEASDDDDMLMFKPLHGSRLIKVIRLLPEFGGMLQAASAKRLIQDSIKQTEQSNSTAQYVHQGDRSNNPPSLVEDMMMQLSQASESFKFQNLANHEDNMILSGKRVLLAEDDFILQLVTVQKLKMMGAAVTVATNGKEAFEFVSKVFDGLDFSEIRPPFDFIFMDCEMPVMDGYEATRAIREMEKGHGFSMPIIALSAHDEDAERDRMIKAGMDYQLVKPFSEDMVTEIIKGRIN